ncbi:MAG: hypothetical protein HY336_02535 [Candidatus Doudnabacteria bacterium]|nr:hypothetical protein [Candidatus Doudnabacteria bacterium]
MSDYKTILGIVSIVVALASYSIYLRGIYKGQTKPHAFSWLIWGVLEAIGFAAQVYGHAGPGSYATAATAIICFTTAGIGFWKGEIKFVRFDWISLGGAFLAIALWLITKNPFYSVILITLADTIGFLPTYRKSYHLPFSEPLITYGLSSLKEGLALIALSSFTFITAFYIGEVAIANLVFIAMVLIRRKQLQKISHA